MEKKEANKGTINERFFDLVTTKKNRIFKEVLAAVEKECRKFNADPHFFDKNTNPKVGYGLIRKSLLDSVNDLSRFVGLVLNEVEIKPIKAIITIDEKVINDDKNHKKNAPNETTFSDDKDN